MALLTCGSIWAADPPDQNQIENKKVLEQFVAPLSAKWQPGARSALFCQPMNTERLTQLDRTKKLPA
jgi:hypothetical protein